MRTILSDKTPILFEFSISIPSKTKSAVDAGFVT
jgi:hypothetical protein